MSDQGPDEQPMVVFERSSQYGANLRSRTKRFALDVIDLSSRIPRNLTGQVLARQLVRSGTSVGAHYCEARRSRSNAELISKLEVALQELDETYYWLELLVESATMPADACAPLLKEADELIRMIVAGVKTTKDLR